MKNIFLAVIFLISVISVIGCGSNASESASEAASETNSTPAAATAQLAYICPMECEGSASSEPGKCPVCGMDLVKNPKYTGTTTDSAAHSTH